MSSQTDLFCEVPDSGQPLAKTGKQAKKNAHDWPNFPHHRHADGKGWVITVPDGELYYDPNFLTERIADRCLEVFLGNTGNMTPVTPWADLTEDQWKAIRFELIPWQRDVIRMYGKEIPLPRLSSWHGDPERAYTYSGIHLKPQPWNIPLDWLRDQLECLCGIRFNSVLMNWYRDGHDHISWHADDETELGKNPVIASVNLGATRRFLLRRADDQALKIEFPLSHGSVLIMSGALQHHWQHSVPKQAAVNDSRINLTFRVIGEN